MPKTRQAARRFARERAKGGTAVALEAAPAAVATAATPPKPSPWILDRWRDLLLFVGTPALLIPIFSAAQSRWSAQDIFLFVGAFGAMGHHLPGMIRAYGDPGLFRRFKTRFVIAPIALLAVCIWSTFYNVQAVQLVAFAWGIWHGMMQTYGFSRIYDAKGSAAAAAARARADFALCLSWFIAAVLLSPLRFRSALDLYYESGGPVIPPVAVVAARNSLVVMLAAVTAFFLWRHWRDWRAGRAISPVKMTLLLSSIGFWWYCNNGVQNILVGIALFEVFHDVQYLAIVWIYNRTRVERDESIGGFMRFVFRRSGSLIGVYVGLVVAYGALGLVAQGVSSEWIKQSLIGVVTASALLHFYYDGFIWKVRETQTRSALGINDPGMVASSLRRPIPVWLGHSLRWAALGVPFAALCAAQLAGRTVPAVERTEKVAEVLPHDAKAQLNHGKALHEAGRTQEAIARYEAAVTLQPSLAEAQMFLGLAWSDLGELNRSVEHYNRALELEPKDARAECNLAGVLARSGRRVEARQRFEHSLELDPKLFLAHKGLADLLRGAGDYDGAITHYSEALRLNPDLVEARDGLEAVRIVSGKR